MAHAEAMTVETGRAVIVRVGMGGSVSVTICVIMFVSESGSAFEMAFVIGFAFGRAGLPEVGGLGTAVRANPRPKLPKELPLCPQRPESDPDDQGTGQQLEPHLDASRFETRQA